MQNKLNEIAAGFRDPDRRYGVFQIIHGGAADPGRADYYDRRGFAGIVGNLPYNWDFPDDEEGWRNTEAGFREYIRRGMKTWIYDEKGYPSGTAGGYVTEKHPEFVARGLYCYDYWRVIGGPSRYRADVPGERLWKALLIPLGEAGTPNGGEPLTDRDPIDVTDCLNENGVLYIDVPAGRYWLFMMCTRRLFDGTHATESYSEPRNYISLSDKAAAKAFTDCTHERYKRILSDEFGRGILAMFTDEPSLISWNIRSGVFPILPWLDSYPADFEARYGYPMAYACAAVVIGKGRDVIRRRCDFWDFIADTVADGFFGTIRAWCRENGLKSSGHMLEEERLQAHIINYGSFFRAARQFDWPGIDQLQTETGALMYEGSIPIARFLASFADLNGEHEVFTEFSDHSVRERGEVAPLSCYYGSVNWHLAMGVNNFTSYYSWDGIGDGECRDFNRYTARSGWLLRQGKRDSRAAVFYPEAAMWSAYTPSTAPRAVDRSPETAALDYAFPRAMWSLIKAQIDEDCIDRRILAEAEVKDGRLLWGDRSWAVILLPHARVMETDAMKKLLEAEAGGVTVLFLDTPPVLCRETGEPSPQTAEIARRVKSGRMSVCSAKDLPSALPALLPDAARSIRVTADDGSDPAMLLSHVRITEEGLRIVYLANMAAGDFAGTLAVPGRWSEIFSADAFTGDITPAARESGSGEEAVLRIAVRPGEGRFWILCP